MEIKSWKFMVNFPVACDPEVSVIVIASINCKKLRISSDLLSQ